MVSHRNWGASVANIPKFFTGHGSRSDYTKSYDVRCYPLHYLLMAVGQMEVDYLSLDIEGAELSVLKTIPFDKVSIKVITVEINNGQEADVTQFLKEHGYKKMRYIKNEVAHDNVYMKNGNELPSEPNLDAIRANYLSPARWAFKRPRQHTSTNVRRTSVAKFVQKNLLKNKSFGFFVEAGANDGELNSHTLALEVFDGWTGLLVEANPQLRQMLLTKKRNVWVASCCLSTQPNVSEVQISEEKLGPAKSPCVPLHHLLNAIGQKDVDFMSLNDGAGAELSILKTIPFDKINITVISVETNEPSKDWTEIPEYLGKYGYKKMEFTTHGANALFMKVEE
ncbi:unnamed protein product [Orchesella dallaii]|uniref:Methyltransferase FkbM domain-containing protein n=1 Tax=Orchesella dallaii TaxID=48710 RepID=A0ABP1QCB7_9HEXA